MTYQTVKTKTNINKKAKKGFNIALFNRFFYLFIIVCGIYYVLGINNLAIKGFVLKEMKMDYEEVKEANKNLELQAMTMGSYDSISRRASQMRMVKVEKIDYITITKDGVARK
jgi:hypothetical protein